MVHCVRLGGLPRKGNVGTRRVSLTKRQKLSVKTQLTASNNVKLECMSLPTNDRLVQ